MHSSLFCMTTRIGKQFCITTSVSSGSTNSAAWNPTACIVVGTGDTQEKLSLKSAVMAPVDDWAHIYAWVVSSLCATSSHSLLSQLCFGNHPWLLDLNSMDISILAQEHAGYLLQNNINYWEWSWNLSGFFIIQKRMLHLSAILTTEEKTLSWIFKLPRYSFLCFFMISLKRIIKIIFSMTIINV